MKFSDLIKSNRDYFKKMLALFSLRNNKMELKELLNCLVNSLPLKPLKYNKMRLCPVIDNNSPSPSSSPTSKIDVNPIDCDDDHIFNLKKVEKKQEGKLTHKR